MATYQQLYSALRAASAAADAGDQGAAKDAAALAHMLQNKDYDEDSNALASGAQGVASGATLGMSDEIGAGVRSAVLDPLVSMAAGSNVGGVKGFKDYFTGMGERYDINLQSQRDAMEKARREDPWITGTGELAGGIATGGTGLARLAAGKGLAKGTALLATGGAAEGAAAGYGYSQADPLRESLRAWNPDASDEDIAKRDAAVKTALRDVKIGAGVGGAFGAVSPAAGMFGRKVISSIAGLTPGVKRAKVSEAMRARIADALNEDLEAGNITLDDVKKQLDENPELMLSDIGSSLRDETEKLTQTPTRGGRAMRQALKTRTEGQYGRLKPYIAEALGQPGDSFAQARRTLVKETKEKADRLYQVAYAKPIAINHKMARFMNMDESESAWKQADRLREATDERPLIKRMRGIGEEMSTEDIDSFIQGWDDKISALYGSGDNKLAKAFKERFAAFKKQVYAENPTYEAARKTWSDDITNKDALDAGKKLFRQDADEIAFDMADMSDSQRMFFRIGALRAVTKLVGNKSDLADATKGVFDKPNGRAIIRSVFGDEDKFREFMDVVGTERKMYETFTEAVGNSKTAKRMWDVDVPGSNTAALGGYLLGLKMGGIAPAIVGFGTKKMYQKLMKPGIVKRMQHGSEEVNRMLSTGGANAPDMLNYIMKPQTLGGLLGQGVPTSVPQGMGGLLPWIEGQTQ